MIVAATVAAAELRAQSISTFYERIGSSFTDRNLGPFRMGARTSSCRIRRFTAGRTPTPTWGAPSPKAFRRERTPEMSEEPGRHRRSYDFLLASLETHVFDEFSLGYALIGPTEVRVILIALNTMALVSRPEPFGVRGVGATVFDVGGVIGVAAMPGMLIARATRNLRTLARIEPPHRR